MLGINPGDGSCRHAEVEMVGHRVGTSSLRVGAADLLLELAKTGLDFPPGGIIFDDLLDAQIQIRGHQRDPLCPAIDPYHPHRATQGLEHHEPIGGLRLAQGAVHMHRVGPGLLAHGRSQVRRAAETFAVLARSSGTTRVARRDGIEGGIHPQTREQVDACAQALTQRLEQSVVAEPAVGDHQDRHLGKHRAKACDQLHGLRELAAKDHRLATYSDTTLRQAATAQVEGEGQRQASPAPVNLLEQSHRIEWF